MKSEIYFDEIKNHILTEIKKAKEFIFVAVSWFTDDELFKAIVDKAINGVKVELLINNDDINMNSGINFSILTDAGGKVMLIDDILMHNKFCIIDAFIVINGSFNWTKKASYNIENITIHRDYIIANKFCLEFEKTKEISKSLILNNNDRYSFDISSFDYEKVNQILNNQISNSNFYLALRLIEEAFLLFPNKNQELILLKTRCFLEQNNYTMAIIEFDKFLKNDPENIEILTDKGNALRIIENFENSFNCFLLALEQDFLSEKTRFSRIKLMIDIDEYIDKYQIIIWGIYYRNDEKSKELFNQFEEKKWLYDNYDTIKKSLITDLEFLLNNKLFSFFNETEIESYLYKYKMKFLSVKERLMFLDEQINGNKKDSNLYYDRANLYFLYLKDTEHSLNDINKAIELNPLVSKYQNLLLSIKKEKRKKFWRSWIE